MWAGKGVTEARSRSRTCWIDPWSWEEAQRQGYTERGIVPWPVDDLERGAAGAEIRRASLPLPSVCRWRGKSRGCRPWPPQLLRQSWTVRGHGGSATESLEHGKHWSSSCVFSTWHVGSGTKPGNREDVRRREKQWLLVHASSLYKEQIGYSLR